MRRLKNMGSVFTVVLLLQMSTSIFALEPGDAAPEFDLPRLDTGQSLKLSDLKGKVLYIDFWASWCGPCRQSLPLYEAMQARLPPESFQIVAINLDEDSADASSFLEKHPVSYTVLLNPDGDVAESFALRVMPTSYLVDQLGQISAIYAGFVPSHIEEIEHAIRTLIENP